MIPTRKKVKEKERVDEMDKHGLKWFMVGEREKNRN
jgi:hypothetical protein